MVHAGLKDDHSFEHIVLWAGLVYVDHLVVHHLFMCTILAQAKIAC